MNFFEHQDQARKKTGHLVFFFILAIVCLIGLTNFLVVGVIAYLGGANVNNGHAIINFLELDTLVAITLVIVSVVTLASLYKLKQLSGGGRVVAEAMAGRLLNVGDLDADERKVLNIVEEMAIASGLPVPAVYLIEEPGINAFAAGYEPADAVIGITRGCISLMNRDELQGVIAHEFSHILHGDMRLNIRLIGILHGILVIGIIGGYILRGISRSGYRSRSGKNKNALPFLLLGAGLMIIGYAGTFFGNIIKAAVSRQREFLADASAVQFTRNPSGISGALQKIGGYSAGSEIRHPYAPEMSHLFFGQAIRTLFSGLMATHPPLELRIRRIDPHWGGNYPRVEPAQGFSDIYTHQAVNTSQAGTESGFVSANNALAGSEQTSASQANTGLNAESVQSGLIAAVGELTPGHREFARLFLDSLPEVIRQAAHEPYGARALVYCLLLDNEQPVRDKQLGMLRDNADPCVFELINDLISHLGVFTGESHRLPLIELCLPALKQLSDRQWRVFKSNLVLLMQADDHIELYEWALYRIILHSIEKQAFRLGDKGAIGSLRLVTKAIGLVLSAVASSGAGSQEKAQAGFAAARDYLGLRRIKYSTREQYSLKDLSRAIALLNRVKPLLKPRLLKAMCLCASHDNKIKPVEIELIRALSASLDCPMPPLLLHQGPSI